MKITSYSHIKIKIYHIKFINKQGILLDKIIASQKN